MSQKDVNGNYWLTFEGEDDVCSQCDKPIKEGDKIFVDAEGIYHKNKNMIEISDVSIYHYNCIVEATPADREPTMEDMM